jgi:hypothetical protein
MKLLCKLSHTYKLESSDTLYSQNSLGDIRDYIKCQELIKYNNKRIRQPDIINMLCLFEY